ncbi:MAG: ABC transporter ATP-binding protein [Lactobacillaceae bacterium]|jgi:sulfonate transport system ATP-binding protein|nr:ABC transporter ATP-binding protein [Lactobacillaceae bacterium]
MSTFLEAKNLKKAYNGRTIIDHVNFKVETGSIVALVGKSGGGKSTLLRLISGIEEATAGELLKKDQKFSGIQADTRIMFQNGRLLPWEKVIDNVLLVNDQSTSQQAMGLLKEVGLDHLSESYPNALSGGEQQRVALARALITQPELLLLDEPLGALDALTRRNMQQLIVDLWQRFKFTGVLVTHDVEEAVKVADEVYVVNRETLSEKFDLRHLDRPRDSTTPAFQKVVKEILHDITGD